MNEPNNQDLPHLPSTHSALLKYPKAIYFLLMAQVLRSIAVTGRTSVIILYLSSNLQFSEPKAMLLLHGFFTATFFLGVIGGIVSDSWLSKFRTILWFTPVFIFAESFTFIGSFPGVRFMQLLSAYTSLTLHAMSGGFIMACVGPFESDQFQLPHQKKKLTRFLSINYVMMNVGALIARICMPALRNIGCFKRVHCYPLAFGAILFATIFNYIVFVSGYRFYKILKPQGKCVAHRVFLLMFHAIVQKKKAEEKNLVNWLDYAGDKYSKEEIADTKKFLFLCLTFLPTIFFYSLYSQMDSTWTFQATVLDGRLGSAVILPEQMSMLNPALLLLMVPLFDYVLYPQFGKVNFLTTPLTRMVLGGFIAAISFFIAGILQLEIQRWTPKLPGPHEAQLRVYNAAPCEIQVKNDLDFSIAPLSLWENLDINMRSSYAVKNVIVYCTPKIKLYTTFELNAGKVSYYLISLNEVEQSLNNKPLELYGYSELLKQSLARPKVKLIYAVDQSVLIIFSGEKGDIIKRTTDPNIDQSEWIEDFSYGSYNMRIEADSQLNVLKPFRLEPGGVYIIMIAKIYNSWVSKLFTITPSNKLHILWQVPQYFVITLAEVLFAVTGFIITVSEAPTSMKALMSALRFFSASLGNALVLFTTVTVTKNVVLHFFSCSACMVAVMILFTIIAKRFKMHRRGEDENSSTEDSL